MELSAAVFWSISNIFSLFLLFTAVTNSSLNTTYNDQNVIHHVTDNHTTTQPIELYSTIPQTPMSSSTERPGEPTTPAEPLPVSGRLLAPGTTVGSLCPCDKLMNVCDINCCCDRACNKEIALFTGCSVDTISGKKQLCSNVVVTYSLESRFNGYSELYSFVRKEINHDIFCIQSQNRVDGLSHPSPALPTESNFDSLFDKYIRFYFGSETPVKRQSLSGYQCGDVMVTAGESGQGGIFQLPAPLITSDCVDNSPAAFLKHQSSRCSRRLDLKHDCESLLALHIDTYTKMWLFAGKTPDAAVFVTLLELVPVELASVVLQTVDGSQTELMNSGGKNLNPVLLNPTLCVNVVLKVAYVTTFNPSGKIVNVTVSLVLGFVREAALSLEQEFSITFVEENGDDGAIHYSGNPGYVVGLPLVSGTRTAEGIVRSVDSRDTVSLLHSARDQDCLQEPHKRSPVLFGLDFVSGCTIRLTDAANCSLVLQVVLDVLRGPNKGRFVASFGNSPLHYPLDWVPMKSNFNPVDEQSCRIPLSLHLQIQWTKYGSLMNPQAQIVSIKEVIQTNITSLDMSGGNSIFSIRTSVAFTSSSAPGLPGYRATPKINANLPFDFFYPFV
ncbi:tectonic-1 isoform X2 [Pungitius pungitius]|uniref:tectonic-1 isoform X2 n=1 Tax=Pungitius pungitius TaxID=134920 RepID=UPI002E107CE3